MEPRLKESERPSSRVARVSYSQNGEDILLDRIFGDQSSGTYLDVGANHPRIDSNTYFFYLRGWRGVNLEPIPRFRRLFDLERPGDLNLEVAATEFDGEIVFHEIANELDETGHSSVREDVAEQHRPLGFQVNSYSVPGRTIATLAREHRIEPPDFMSIDVEGHEAAVLRGVAWADWRPKVLVIESIQSLNHEPTHHEWEPDLLARGYVFATFNGLNRFYLREDFADRVDRLSVPVHVLDRFERADLVEARAKIAEIESSLDYLRRQYDQLIADRRWDQDHFRRVEEGWRFGLEQAALAREAWNRQNAEFEWHRSNFEKAQAEFQVRQGEFDRFRAESEARRVEFEIEREAWSAEKKRLEGERVGLETTIHELDRRLAELSLKLNHAERVLIEAQIELRPYRLLDRLGIVRAGFKAARRMKRKLQPKIAS